MSHVEFRPLTVEEADQSSYVESVAFYNQPTPKRTELLRGAFALQRTVGAFVNGRLAADIRTIPFTRRINGASSGYGGISPVATLAEHRRKGFVTRLMTMSLEYMREQGVPLSGLYTEHDSLYRRYGFERAEGKKRYLFNAKDVTLRYQGERGSFERVEPDAWERLDEVYRRYAAPRNGVIDRVEFWWQNFVLHEFDEDKPNDAFLWLDPAGDPQGYVVYTSKRAATDRLESDLRVQDMVALTSDAYLAIWGHLLTHDVARHIAVHVPLHDHFSDLAVNPWKIQIERAEGPMIRIVDVERALAERPYCGRGAVSFTMRITDPTVPRNEGTWRVRAARRRMRAERTRAKPDIELSVNFLAPLYTGFVRADHAVEAGMIKLNRPDALPQIEEAFAVTHPPYCNDWF